MIYPSRKTCRRRRLPSADSGDPTLIWQSHRPIESPRSLSTAIDVTVSGLELPGFGLDRVSGQHDFADLERARNWRFEFEMYESFVSRNLVQSPSGTGTPLDFRFDQDSNPTINGSAALDWQVKGRPNLRFRYSPFEQRDAVHGYEFGVG